MAAYEKELAEYNAEIAARAERIKAERETIYNYYNGKFRTQFEYKGIRYFVGEYETPEQAHNAYLTAKAAKIEEYEAAKRIRYIV